MKKTLLVVLALVIALAFVGTTFAQDKAVSTPAKDSKAAVATDKAATDKKAAATDKKAAATDKKVTKDAKDKKVTKDAKAAVKKDEAKPAAPAAK
jgi:hypothetical protein